MISKYWLARGLGASPSAKVPSSDAPSSGCCWTPSTTSGNGKPAASSTVGTTSTAWQNCGRTWPLSASPRGQCTISGVRVPPSQA
jgi:hypothetical protein